MSDPVSDVEGREAELRERVARALWDFAFEEETAPGTWESAFDEERAVTLRGADLVLAALGLEQVGSLWIKPTGQHWGLTRLGYWPAFTKQEHLTEQPVYRLSPPSTGADAG